MFSSIELMKNHRIFLGKVLKLLWTAVVVYGSLLFSNTWYWGPALPVLAQKVQVTISHKEQWTQRAFTLHDSVSTKCVFQGQTILTNLFWGQKIVSLVLFMQIILSLLAIFFRLNMLKLSLYYLGKTICNRPSVKMVILKSENYLKKIFFLLFVHWCVLSSANIALINIY